MRTDADLPAATRRYLTEKTPEGERNAALFAAACQFRDAGAGSDEAEAALLPCATRDGLPEPEARKAIRSAFRKQPRQPIKHLHRFMDRELPTRGEGRNGHPSPPLTTVTAPRYQPTPATAGLPEPKQGLVAAYLQIEAAFEPNEMVSICAGAIGEDGRDHPASAGETRTREEWLEMLGSGNDPWPRAPGAGVFVRINPVRAGGKADADVTAFRHALLEWDDLPVERQWPIIRDSRIPCTAVINSGGRSLHAWVRVDAKSAEEYRERVALLHEYFADCPPCAKNKNVSRFSRLAGVARGESKQTLLATGIGAAGFDQWRGEAQDRADGIQVFSFSELASYDFANDPNTLIGNRWVCRGGSAMWVGQSGIGKSSLTAQAAMSWAVGAPFFGVAPVRPLRSLIIQAENDVGDMAEATQGVRRSIGFDPAIRERPDIDALLQQNFIPVRNTTRTGRDVVALASRLIDRYRPDILWLDPLLAYVGDDLKQQKVASEFLREQLGALQMRTGVVVMLVHHTPKPTRNRDGGRPEMSDEDFLYAGLGSVEFVNWPRATIVLRQAANGEDGRPCYVLRFQKRGERAGAVGADGEPGRQIFLQHGSEYISWRQVPEPQAAAARPRNEGQFQPQFNPADLLEFLNAETPVKTGAWQKNAYAEKDIKRATFYRFLPILVKDGKVEKKEGGYVLSAP